MRIIKKFSDSDSDKKNWFDWIDAGLKIVIAIIGILISYIGYSYQKSSTTSALLVQQEKGDTEIRAQMFGKITDRLMPPAKGPDGNGNTDSIVQDALLAQVLAINFHELIDLKPLMIDLDNKLNKAIKNKAYTHSTTLEDVIAAKENLHSAARHIRDKQVAALTGPNTGTNTIQSLVELITGPDTDAGTLEYISVVNEGGDPNNHQCRVNKPEVKNEDTSKNTVPSQNGCLNEMIQITTPKKDKSILIVINKVDWKNERLTVSLSMKKTPEGIISPPPLAKKSSKDNNKDDHCIPQPPEVEKSPPQATSPNRISFELSWFDFPFTDNTLLADGSRYAFFIDRMCKNSETDATPTSVRLGILFFPKDYYPSRERPVSYRQLNEKLGLSTK